MANREISIILRARNAMAAGLSSAGAALKSFGSGVLKVGKWLAVGFLAGAAALAGFTAKAISAYSVQEKAARDAKAAVDIQGQSGKKILPLLAQIASAIQDETGAADESTLAGMAKMRMLGVQTKKLGEAARAVIALKSVGLEEEAAQKAVAMAMQGSYDMLNRYLPALRLTTDATEKARIVNKFFADGYKQQKDVLNTVAGQWAALKGRIGDVWEELGGAIAQNEGLMRVLRRAGEAVKDFGKRINVWVNSERFKAVATSIEGIVAAIAGGGEDRSKALGIVGEVLQASLARGVEVAVDMLKTAAPVIGKLLGAAARMAWESLTGPSGSDNALARSQLGAEGKSTASNWVTLVKARAKEIQQARMMKEYGLDKIETVEGETKAQNRLRIALIAAGKLGQEFAAKEKVRSDAAAKSEADQAAQSQEYAEQKIKEITNETDVVVKATDTQKKAKLKALKEELSEINRKKALWEGLAKTRVEAYLEQQKAAKKESRSREKDDAKALRLQGAVDRGARLGGAQKRWLDAYNKINNAKGIAAQLKDAGKTVEGQIQMAEETLRVQEAIKSSLENIERQNEKLLTYSGG